MPFFIFNTLYNHFYFLSSPLNFVDNFDILWIIFSCSSFFYLMDNETLWKTVLAEIEVTVTRGTFNTFFATSRLLSLKDNIAVIGCSNQYFCDLIEKRYYSLIKDVFDKITKKNNQLTFVAFKKEKDLKTEDFGPLFSQPQIKQDDEVSLLKKKAGLRDDFTFENFCVSSSNEMAYAAATAVSKSPGKTYNPLFLYGGVGVGKTHLMQAIGHKLIERGLVKRVVYCMGEDFTNEIIEAIRNKTTKQFRDKYRKADALLIDDIQFIAGKEKVQEEFFHTFNTIYREGGQVVLTSDKEPSEIKGLEDRLRSRFEGGLAIDISPPDFELRTAILLTKASQKGINLPIELAKVIAANIESTRKLEGTLTKIQAMAAVKKQPINAEIVTTILGKKEKNIPEEIKQKSPKEFLTAVCSFYSLKQSEIKGQCRKKELVLPRQVLMYLLRNDLNLSFVEIGTFLEGRDHTTIMHGVAKITQLISTSGAIREAVDQIRKKLGEN